MRRKVPSFGLVIVLAFSYSTACQNRGTQKAPASQTTLLFEDSGTADWLEKWMLDGQRAKVINTDSGMELVAGPEHGNDTCHAVLWTRQSFSGNIGIEYDYTRTDTATRCVNILYFLATGKGGPAFPADISLWNEKRAVPHMHTYFNNMHTYHISYAAFSANEYSGDNDYIRLRRYDPTQKGLNGTDVPGDHFNTGLFKPYISYHIQVLKYGNLIEMRVQNKQKPAERMTFHWDVSGFPECESGRVGFRHMYTRSARYKDIKVWQLE